MLKSLDIGLLRPKKHITMKQLSLLQLLVTEDVDGTASIIEKTEPALFMPRLEEKKIIRHYGLFKQYVITKLEKRHKIYDVTTDCHYRLGSSVNIEMLTPTF